MEGAHFLEIRGTGVAVTEPARADGHLAAVIIRIHPRRVIAYNVDPDQPGLQTRGVAAAGDGAAVGDARPSVA